MTRRIRNPLRTAPLLLTCLAFISPGMADASNEPAESDVLTVKEAAEMLRIPPSVVSKLAHAGNIPARRIGSRWRFSRLALMEWLQGDRYAYPVVPKGASKLADATPKSVSVAPDQPPVSQPDAPALGSGLTVAELSGFRGAGRGEPVQLAQAPSSQTVPSLPATQPIGERPTGPTAEETALLEQGIALLKGGAKTLELGISYTRVERRPPSSLLLRDEVDAVTTTLIGRYGIRDDLQFTARLPYQYRRRLQVTQVGVGQFDSARTSAGFLGDASASLLGVAIRENIGRPSFIWSLDAVIPTGPGDAGLGAGLALSKSYDPVALFAGLSYLYGISTDPNNERRNLARHNWGFNAGYAYAVNDSIALSGQFAGNYRIRESSNLDPLPARESYLVQLGITWQLGRGLFIDPAIAFGVGSNSPDMSFSTSLIYSF